MSSTQIKVMKTIKVFDIGIIKQSIINKIIYLKSSLKWKKLQNNSKQCYIQKHIYLGKIHKEETTLEKLKEEDETMFQHHKKTHCVKRPKWIKKDSLTWIEIYMFHLFMRNE